MCGADIWVRITSASGKGSPPRVRSRPRRDPRGRHAPGITSACAEQTDLLLLAPVCTWDHLRVCGADGRVLDYVVYHAGSPPRVRSRRVAVDAGDAVDGITSACAEQTPTCREPSQTWRDHLRVCGADSSCRSCCPFCWGSPPRVRSRPLSMARYTVGEGITSACAEQTGEADDGMGRQWGSPPRVRSRPITAIPVVRQRRITSACAEQTALMASEMFSLRDHLRVCGADEPDNSPSLCANGSPPRVRSRRGGLDCGRTVVGITSACAEQTFESLIQVVQVLGSPPRVRSRRETSSHQGLRRGITSACAEQTSTRSPWCCRDWDHLRVCGADYLLRVAVSHSVGSPPRVRSRR